MNKNSMTALWNGTALRIDRDSLAKICTVLGCTPGDLLVIGGEPPEDLVSGAAAVAEGSGEGL